MKNLKKFLAGSIAVCTLTAAATTLTALAAPAYETPAEAAAAVTGKTLEDVLAERQSGKSYGMIAAEAGALEEFQEAMLEFRQEALASRVEDGTITQDQADEWLATFQQRQAACDGTGAGGCGLGAGYGGGRGAGRGYGRGMGRGGLQNGSCPIFNS